MSESKVIESLKKACKEDSGILTIVRIDNYDELSHIRDVAGDVLTKQLREECIRIIDAATDVDYIKASLGENEFVLFVYDIKNKKDLAEIYFKVVKKINESISDRISDDISACVEISVGAAIVPEQGNDYLTLFSKADRALEYVSESGGHTIAFYDQDEDQEDEHGGAMWLDEDEYRVVYDFMSKYIKTYKRPACELEITFYPHDDEMDIDIYTEILCQYVEAVRHTLRESDSMTLIGNQLVMLLPEMSGQFVPGILNRIKNKMQAVGYGNLLDISISSTMIGPDQEQTISINLAV